MKNLDDFTRAYLECALWAELDSEGNPLDGNYDIRSFSPEAIEKAENDCIRFQAENAEDLESVRYNYEYLDVTTAGRDFWLTRNNHGAGFWDGGLPEELGQRLSVAARTFGECYIEEHYGQLYLY